MTDPYSANSTHQEHASYANSPSGHTSDAHSAPPSYSHPYYYSPYARKKSVWPWVVLWISLAVIVFCFIAVVWQSSATEETYAYVGENVALLYVEGTLSTASASGDSYNHQYILDTVDFLIEDPDNLGLMVYFDSPGGEVTAGDELLRKFSQYQTLTSRPLYVYGYDYLASGAYWASCGADRIILNPYCITGSIGVTYGTMLDLSGFLEKYGIEAYTVNSGENKSMGDMLLGTTPEQQAILQQIIDEYYSYFIQAISQGRHMDEEAVRALADGRIYSATQGVANGLVDEVAYFEDAVADFADLCGVNLSQVIPYQYIPEENLWSFLAHSQYEQKNLWQKMEEYSEMNGFFCYYMGTGHLTEN